MNCSQFARSMVCRQTNFSQLLLESIGHRRASFQAEVCSGPELFNSLVLPERESLLSINIPAAHSASPSLRLLQLGGWAFVQNLNTKRTNISGALYLVLEFLRHD
jgi:hypothetical protein